MNQTISPHPCAHLYGWEIKDHADPATSGRLAESAPRFSVVIPTLNQAETIEDTLLSLIHQDYPDLEIIVADGGSSDGTAAILNRYREELSAVLPGPDTGQSNAINKGFARASGDIFFWLNSDDYLLPDTLWRVAACFLADADLEFAVGAGDVISLDHHFLRHIPPLPMDEATMLNWKNDQWVMQQCCFWTNTLWQSVGGVDEQLHLLMDYDLWFRFSRRTKAAMINEKLAVMRYYPDAKTVKQRSKTSEELAYVYAKNGAYTSLREQVADLVVQRGASENYLNRIHSSLPVRLLKRLSLFPTPANPGP
ncbi:glycosyltransferase family 2 protein [Vulcanococcus limneticus]|uniref:glycosyltransferase family 2 protein n=1 Tax=Vulcanococcus limneticus TaxID=2170428 RepID=UPI00398BEBD0